jgi:hypothetical protein
MYADRYQVLQGVAEAAFGPGCKLRNAAEYLSAEPVEGRTVIVFGKRWGKELRLPAKGGRGSYFVDWVLALLTPTGELEKFVAVEVQTIDTIGSYREERDAYITGQSFQGTSTAGLNWENVNKRILPQLIYKGHVLPEGEALRERALLRVSEAGVRTCPKASWRELESNPPPTGSAYVPLVRSWPAAEAWHGTHTPVWRPIHDHGRPGGARVHSPARSA